MRVGPVAHQFRVAEPTIGHQHGWGQGHTAFGGGGQTLIEQVLGEMELVLAFAPRPFGIGAADGKINRNDEFAIADDHEQQHPIDAKDGAFELTTPPAAHESEVVAIFSKYRIVNDPSPLPTALGRGALVLGMAPYAQQNLKAQAPQAFEPRAFGQRIQEFGRDVFVQTPYAGEFMRMSSAKERGKHDPHDFTQELLLRLQAAFDLGHERLGDPQVVESLMDGLAIAPCIGTLLSEALLG